MKKYIISVFILFISVMLNGAVLSVHINDIDGVANVKLGKMKLHSDEFGNAVFYNVKPGNYRLKVKSEKGYVIKNVTVGLGKNEIEIYYDNEMYSETNQNQRIVPYLENRTSKKVNKSIKLNLPISLNGLNGYNYLPTSLVRKEGSFGISYGRNYMKGDNDTRNTNIFSCSYGFGYQTEVSLIHYNMGDIFNTSTYEDNNNTVFALKKKIFKRGVTHDSIGLRASNSRIDLINMTGFKIGPIRKRIGFADIVLENSFFDGESKFKLGAGIRVKIGAGFALSFDGRYNFSDEFSSTSIGLEKNYKNCLINLIYSWADLIENIESYNLGIQYNF